MANCINVKDSPYNATGNGSTDDSTAIQNAINAGGCIFFPNGTYKIYGTTIDIGSPKTLLFESEDAILKYTGSGDAVKIGNEKFITWRRGTIDLTEAGDTAIGLHIKGLWNSDFFGLKVIRDTSDNQVGIKIETSDTGQTDWGSYNINFYQPVLTEGTGLAAIQTTQSASDGVNVTHLSVFGGWINNGTDIFNLRYLSNGLFLNIATEVANKDIYDIDWSNDIIISPGELPGSTTGGYYKFNVRENTEAISIITQMVATDLGINGSRPAIVSRSSSELYGSRSDLTYYVRLLSQYSYASAFKLLAKGGGSEVTLLEWANDAGLILQGGSGGIKLGTGSTGIAKHLSNTKTWDPSSVADGNFTSTTITVTGASLGDTVTVGFTTAVPAGAILSGSVTAAGTVTVTLFNKTGSALDLGSGTLRADVWQH